MELRVGAAGHLLDASWIERAASPRARTLRLAPGVRISPEQKVPYPGGVISARHCSKPGCQRPAVATLTYDYQDSTVVLGPLATFAEPNAYDLCDHHAEHLTAPKGWQVVRLVTNFEPAPPSGDDLLALVDAVRRAAETQRHAAPETPTQSSGTIRPAAREAERGPFASKKEPDTSSPLDPNSSYAKRRARFTVISDD